MLYYRCSLLSAAVEPDFCSSVVISGQAVRLKIKVKIKSEARVTSPCFSRSPVEGSTAEPREEEGEEEVGAAGDEEDGRGRGRRGEREAGL